MGRHESLRTVFPEVDGAPRQVVLSLDEACPDLEVVTVDAAELDEVVRTITDRRFDLATEPPVRAWLFVPAAGTGDGPQEPVLVVLIHHIAGDGSSGAPAPTVRTA